MKKNVTKLNENGVPIKQLCFGLINGDIPSKIKFYEGDFEEAVDAVLTFDGGEINASGYGELDGSNFSLVSADITWNGQTISIDESSPFADMISRAISLVGKADLNESKKSNKKVIKLNENTLRQIVAESIKKTLKEMDDFTPHGYKCMNNYGGNEIQISDSGDAARLKFQNGEITDWLEIEFDENGVAYVTTPDGIQEKLSEYMRY